MKGRTLTATFIDEDIISMFSFVAATTKNSQTTNKIQALRQQLKWRLHLEVLIVVGCASQLVTSSFRLVFFFWNFSLFVVTVACSFDGTWCGWLFRLHILCASATAAARTLSVENNYHPTTKQPTKRRKQFKIQNEFFAEELTSIHKIQNYCHTTMGLISRPKVSLRWMMVVKLVVFFFALIQFLWPFFGCFFFARATDWFLPPITDFFVTDWDW